jgi:pilus assembly protein CpaB
VTRRRRAALLLGLALFLGGLAASDVARRERAVARALGPTVPIVVTRNDVAVGTVLHAALLSVRRVPTRYVPAGAYGRLADVVGLRAGVPIPRGVDVVQALLAAQGSDGGPVLRAGERVVDLVATGSPALVRAGGLVDVAITRDGADGRDGHTDLALQRAQVLAAHAAAAGTDDGGAPRVAVSLRVTLRQALLLADAQTFARDIRVLPRAASAGGGAP